MSGRLAPSTARPTGTPLPSASWLRLTPLLARSVGFLPVFFPPEGRLGHAPVHRQPGPVDALQAVVLQQAGLPHLEEDALADVLLEAVVGGRAGAEAGGAQRLPLAAGTEDEEDGVHADAVGGARLAAAEGVGVDVGGDAHLDLGPEVVGDAPVVGDGTVVHEHTGGAWPRVKKAKCCCTRPL
jgi:hypothetical protein